MRESLERKKGGAEETFHNQRETLIRIAEQKGYNFDLFQR